MPDARPRVVRHILEVPSEHESYGCVQEIIEPVYLHEFHPPTPWSFLNSEGIVLRDTQTNGL